MLLCQRSGDSFSDARAPRPPTTPRVGLREPPRGLQTLLGALSAVSDDPTSLPLVMTIVEIP